jgi:aspartate/methionine/tyrosine aminotransferase
MSPGEINELEGLSFLEDLAEEYERENGSAPFDLSHWDPSDQTVSTLLKDLKLPRPLVAAHYIYSYYTGLQKQIIQRLGFPTATRDCLFVQAGTNAMLLATWWLRSLDIRRVLILCPAYFPIFYDSEIMDLHYVRLFMRRDQGQWQLPREEILAEVHETPAGTAVWVTNPVYCTGSYLSKSDAGFLDSLLTDGVTVIGDECLSINGRELGRRLSCSERFLGIYSPHKSVSINAVKFAVVVFDAKFNTFFDRWADVLAGGLSASTYTAMLHFLDDNFQSFQSSFLHHINTVRENVLKILSSRGGPVETDKHSLGHFMTCYAPRVPGDKGNDREFLREMVWNTGAILIPGLRNHFSPDLGFSFRINLARACPQFYSAFHRTIEYIGGMS